MIFLFPRWDMLVPWRVLLLKWGLNCRMVTLRVPVGGHRLRHLRGPLPTCQLVALRNGAPSGVWPGWWFEPGKKGPLGCLEFIGDEISPSYMGIIMNYYKDPYRSNQDSMESKRVFFAWLIWFLVACGFWAFDKTWPRELILIESDFFWNMEKNLSSGKTNIAMGNPPFFS